ncbi:SEC-C metal-binding domain-containing protein [Hymenobacter lapidiphilus]|uniref:SEC-C metal-binding domain-containing protein n=1 Tax=Hymenobacter sp. CCM 8763 TaxID=2303334 RepID=UPI0018F88077|nr:SEC-C metal-binding domain-containing protein [Hymenobacter sp. CCM 8763]
MTSVPAFEHPIFEQLYQRDYFIDDAVLREILALGPAVAVPELLKITAATLADFDYDNPGPNWYHNFHFPHALYLLQELAAPEALDMQRKLLRLSPENLEYWFGDFMGEELPEMLATAGRTKPAELMALLEDGSYLLHNRLLVGQALLRLAREQPGLRPEIVDFLRRYLRHIIGHAAQAQLLFPPDQDFYAYELDTYLGLLLAEVQDAGLRELEPEVRELYLLKLVDESISGAEADIDFDQGRPLPPADDIFGRYQKLREWPENDSPFHPDAAGIAGRKAQAEVARQRAQAEYYQRGTPPLPRQAGPQTGRNDPCPCGSGKKHKKCCLV